MDAKINAFNESPIVISGRELRPITAGSLILLQQVGNPILEKTEIEDVFFHLASFIYIHSADFDEVRVAARDIEKYRDAVLDFSREISVAEISNSASKIKEMIDRAMVGNDYHVESDAHDPN